MKKTALVNRNYCVACGCCLKVCPQKAIHINKGIFAVVNKELCIGCGQCAIECPASVIELEVSEIAE